MEKDGALLSSADHFSIRAVAELACSSGVALAKLLRDFSLGGTGVCPWRWWRESSICLRFSFRVATFLRIRGRAIVLGSKDC